MRPACWHDNHAEHQGLPQMLLLLLGFLDLLLRLLLLWHLFLLVLLLLLLLLLRLLLLPWWDLHDRPVWLWGCRAHR